MNAPKQTRAARRAPPKAARASATILARLSRQTKFVDPSLADHWPSIAGRTIAALCRPGRIIGMRRGHGSSGGRTLEVVAFSGAAATQLQMLATDLQNRVNQYLGPGTIAEISIKQAPGSRIRHAAPAAISSARQDDTPLSAALSSFRAAVGRKNQTK